MGIISGSIIGDIKGDTRSLDHGSDTDKHVKTTSMFAFVQTYTSIACRDGRTRGRLRRAAVGTATGAVQKQACCW